MQDQLHTHWPLAVHLTGLSLLPKEEALGPAARKQVRLGLRCTLTTNSQASSTASCKVKGMALSLPAQASAGVGWG